MKPVDQTTFGNPGGNCFSACVASLLHLRIDDVPYFMGEEAWFDAFNAWLKIRGWWAVCLRLDGGFVPLGYCILGGRSPRPVRGDHAVIGDGLRVVHDPHPSRDGLKTIDDVTILIPVDPGGVS